jgi:hypothetical protein
MDTSRLSRSEYLAIAGAVVLVISLFLPWYQPDPGNPVANIDGARGTLSGWDVHSILRWLLLLLAAAPLILAWIIARGHQLAWARGEVTAIAGLVGLVLLFFNGVVSRPGDPSSAISLKYGWFLAVLGTLLIIAGSVLRTGESGRARRPPGTF